MPWRIVCIVAWCGTSQLIAAGTAFTPVDKELQKAVHAWSTAPTIAEAMYGNIRWWNTSRVTDMSELFSGCHAFNSYIGSWDTSRVTNMSGMFAGAAAFNQQIGGWDTSR
eukprot:6059195-Amphidinium_carterae.1